MAFSVQMPALGESVTEGTVTRWLKQEGDTVEVDEPLLEVSTDKVDTEIPSPVAGVLTKIVAQEDDTVEIGGELAQIGDADDNSGDSSDSAPAEEASKSEPADEPTPAAEPEPQAEQEAPAEDAAPAQSSSSSSSSGSGTTVNMPELGESVTEGTVTRWLKAVGDDVAVDEPLLEVSTDKVDTEIPSPVAGTLLEINAEEDDTVAIGGQLAVIGSGAPAEKAPEPQKAPEPEKAPEPKAEAPKQEAPKQEAPKQQAPKQQAPKQQAPKQEAPKQESSGDSTPYVTPLVRKLAADNDVDLASVKGTGVGGRIRKQDVLAAAEAKKAPAQAAAPESAPAAAKAPVAATAGVRPELAHLRGTTQKINRIRQITAKKTRESLQSTAQLTQTFEVDVTTIAALRSKAKSTFQKNEGVNLTYLPFFAKAVVEALKAHPNVNASIDEDKKEITYHSGVHLGIAVDTEQGLLSPVIHNAGDLSLAGLARAIADIASRARSNGLKPDELSGGTFTITNIGSQGALFDTPILVPPQAAMLGTGAIVKRPVVVKDGAGNESIGVRSMVYLPLTYDHRLVDGADAGRFLTTIKQRLEDASFEADLGI
ncbi:2-oxoglutarate dehydrogenase, E2 component, dihydrolipoamide succinyltransferase [Rhodococcoides yunnanense]|jgi:pyruvate dehydrogenase E2 component (dihydrolipoamide acetyltransferase)|uniref:2-oxoglutarate dehydrogenase, E2 component, dihydrolipoamide succinyltransferase n=1 Tax=Rhodococcoides yunnanense TaxID=278209 RepID=UPI0022B183FC|nr:2-oxoglutarate dehydrogenase, E2 component, dihydrolipoamide succinyltransferase [Rhodococcus yunnanensis]MCZ4278552.1 2-oxoglutarate dehydrogenase, E2 component, dihydrolipoamide succinyltransferase [Rhodococcus yunnanensis]